MQLASKTYGNETAQPPLLVVHGLFGSGRNWGALAKRFALKRQVVAVDMRNHGESPWHEIHDYPAMAADLAEVIAAHGGRMDVLGHSMGGKAAMVLALTEPGSVHRLVVADVAPVGYTHTQMHYIEAMRGLDLASVARRSQADAALRETVPEAGVRAFLLQSLAIEDGKAEWRLNLDTLGAEMPKIIGFPETDARFTGPTFFLVGGKSDYVKAEHRDRVLALFPKAEYDVLKAAGHWLHADDPNGFIVAVEGFLDRD